MALAAALFAMLVARGAYLPSVHAFATSTLGSSLLIALLAYLANLYDP